MKSKNQYLPFLFFGLLITFFVIRGLIHEKKLEEAPRYTVGKVKKISFPVDGGPMADYTFEVNGKTYNGTFSIPIREKREPEPKISVNDKFLVKFYNGNPAISYPMSEITFSDTATAPESGWTAMPKK